MEANVATWTYGIPLNEPAHPGATVTVLSVQIQDANPRRRGAILRRILRENYGITRQQAKDVLRAMCFDTLIV